MFTFFTFNIEFDLEEAPYPHTMPGHVLVNRGHLIPNSFVKDIIQVSNPTNSNWNKFMQYMAANGAIIKWEKKIKKISQQCLNTKGFSSATIKSDFYLISGTKPYSKGSSRNIKVSDLAIPQLQWTAMCCKMKISVKSARADVVMAGGYIGSNVKLNARFSEGDGDFFPLFPPYKNDQMLMDLPMLRRGMEGQFEDTTDVSTDDVPMKAEYFFGENNPCDTQERKNDWISSIMQG